MYAMVPRHIKKNTPLKNDLPCLVDPNTMNFKQINSKSLDRHGAGIYSEIKGGLNQDISCLQYEDPSNPRCVQYLLPLSGTFTYTW